MVDPALFAAHEETCPRKAKLCKFCENNWPQGEFAKHV